MKTKKARKSLSVELGPRCSVVWSVEDAMGIAIQVKEIRPQRKVIAPGESGFDDIRKLREFIELTLDIRRR
jgi:hypothetical protein